MSKIRNLSMIEMHTSLRAGDISVSDIMEESICAHKAYQTQDLAYISWKGNESLQTYANAIDNLIGNGGDAGMLMGMPVSIKDNFGVKGFETYAGTRSPLGKKWSQSGPIVSTISEQLAVILGKTHTAELAFSAMGINSHWEGPNNPWSQGMHKRVPGGSSSGAGVSVTNGTAVLALGTDTAGSVRIPASLTGVAGLKTSFGRWSNDGIFPLSKSTDTIGLMARTVDDLYFSFQAIERKKINLELMDLSGVRIGVPSKFFWDDCDDSISNIAKKTISIIENHGVKLVQHELTGSEQAFDLVRKGGLAAPELYSFLMDEEPDLINSISPHTAARLSPGIGMPAYEYINRLEKAHELSKSASETFKNIDAIIVPTVCISPPEVKGISGTHHGINTNMRLLKNTCIANIMGLCSITMPIGLDTNSMPVGLQLIGANGDDEKILAIGRSIEGIIGKGVDLIGSPR